MADNPTLMSLKQASPDSVRVKWSPPSEGATVTGYVIHYKTATSVRNKSVSQNFTGTFLLSLIRGATYIISVQATSQHLSGESEEMNITLQLGVQLYSKCSLALLLCIHTHTIIIIQDD